MLITILELSHHPNPTALPDPSCNGPPQVLSLPAILVSALIRTHMAPSAWFPSHTADIRQDRTVPCPTLTPRCGLQTRSYLPRPCTWRCRQPCSTTITHFGSVPHTPKSALQTCLCPSFRSSPQRNANTHPESVLKTLQTPPSNTRNSILHTNQNFGLQPRWD